MRGSLNVFGSHRETQHKYLGTVLSSRPPSSEMAFFKTEMAESAGSMQRDGVAPSKTAITEDVESVRHGEAAVARMDTKEEAQLGIPSAEKHQDLHRGLKPRHLTMIGALILLSSN